jgi:hypothetical protein
VPLLLVYIIQIKFSSYNFSENFVILGSSETNQTSATIVDGYGGLNWWNISDFTNESRYNIFPCVILCISCMVQ